MRICGHIASSGRRIAGGVVPPAPIYGLRFDGINDNAFFDVGGTFTDFTMKFRKTASTVQDGCYLIWRNGIGMFAPRTDKNNITLLQGGSTAFVNAWDVTANGEYNFEMTLNSSEVITSSSLDASSSTPANSRAGGTSSTQIVFASRVQNDFYQAFDLLNFTVDSVLYNYANSWGGMTINGAILIVSTDGGSTWNPV